MEHETLGEEVLEHAEVAMPQLDVSIYPNLIFWLVVSLLLLYFLLTRLALPRIARALEERSDAITSELEQAALLKKRAEDAELAYNAALAKAREAAQAIAAETKAEIGKELSVLTAKSNAEIAARAAESEGRIREIQDSAAQSVEEVAKAATADIIELFLPGGANKSAVTRAIAARLKG
jgi:F-type H+-transporting ATPase subunit b